MKKCKKFIAFVCIFAMLFSMIGYTDATPAKGNDITGHWAAKDLADWVAKGYITADSAGLVEPDSVITRAEFANYVNKAFKFKEKATVSFVDVKSTDIFADDVAKAVKAGYMVGNGDNTWKPNATITRQEVAVLLARLLGLDDKSNVLAFAGFGDKAKIETWSTNSVIAVSAKGYMTGDGKNFNPLSNMTRAEAITLLTRADGDYYGFIIKTPGVVNTPKLDGSVYVKANNVEMKGTEITGNLVIGKEVGDGNFTLRDSVVKGNIVINGGGVNSIHLINVVTGNVIVQRAKGNVRVSLEGTSNISNLSVLTPASLQLAAQSRIAALVLNSPAAITGTGTITSTAINTRGVTSTITLPNVTGSVGSSGVTPPPTTPAAPSTGGSSGSGGGSDGGGSSTVYVNAITVTSAGNATTVENGSTLQMSAAVTPSNATNKTVTWSVTNGTGTATINSAGLLTATGVGTVTVKATSVSTPSVNGTKVITISGEEDKEIIAFAALANVDAGTAGAAIYANAAAVIAALPTIATANARGVTVPVPVTTWVDTDAYNAAVAGSYTFTATLGAIPAGFANTGKFTATVEVVVVAAADVQVTSITVSGTGNATTVVNGETLQMLVAVAPTNATNKTVIWSVTNETGTALIDPSTGFLQATGVGTVTVKATNAASGVYGTKVIIITPAPVVVNKATLINAISAANTNAGTVTESVYGTDVAVGTCWVTTAVKTAYTNAITAAQVVADDADATQGEVDDAVTALGTATGTFNTAKAEGTMPAPIIDVTLQNAIISVADEIVICIYQSIGGVDSEIPSLVADDFTLTKDFSGAATIISGFTLTPSVGTWEYSIQPQSGQTFAAGNYRLIFNKAGYSLEHIDFVVAADVEITAFDTIGNVDAGIAGAATYANAAAVIAALPTIATANAGAVTVPVTTWVDADAYNPAVAGSYTFTATLGAIPAGYVNTGNFTATVEVVVAPANAANATTVATVKGLVAGATYEMMQAAAINEAAVKTAIESVISGLVLDGVTTTVSKVDYTEAVAGTAGTPDGTNGTYTFTVELSKGADATLATDTTATLAMTITATVYVAPANESLTSTTITNFNYETVYATQARLVSKAITTSDFGPGNNRSFTITDGAGNNIPVNLNWNIGLNEYATTYAAAVGSAVESVIQDYFYQKGGNDGLMNRTLCASAVSGANGYGDQFYISTFATGTTSSITISGTDASYFFDTLQANGTNDDTSKNRTFTIHDGTNTATISLKYSYVDMSRLVSNINNMLRKSQISATVEKVDESHFRLVTKTPGVHLTIEGTNKTDFFGTFESQTKVTSITVNSAGDVNTVVNGSTLQMSATVAPANATNKTVTWSVEPLAGGAATIDVITGLLTATGVGTVTVKAVAKDGSGVEGTQIITIVPPTPIAASISNVTATNGAVTITLEAKPTVAVVADDFSATIDVDGAGANSLTLAGFNYDGNVTITYTFAAVAQTASAQSVVVKVKLAGNETEANAFTVDAISAQQAAINTINEAAGDYTKSKNISLETINTAIARTNAIAANLSSYQSDISSKIKQVDGAYIADTIWDLVNTVNTNKAASALKALGSAGITCVDPTASPLVTFPRPAALADGTGITFGIGYQFGSDINVIPQYPISDLTIDRNGGGSIIIDVNVKSASDWGLLVHYLVTVPAGTDAVTWVLVP